ncbi:MAG TPA: permease [Candidatus Atribacteria bacterium]|nr:permease [Candidatus Atribacteria bacterium]
MWQTALQEGLRTIVAYLNPWHLLLGIMPAFLISGAIATLMDRENILRFFGPGANKWIAITIASIAGAILAVCSCSILPMFTSMYKIGAGIGPATSFLYSGPAINTAAIFISAAILGKIGWARSLSAVIVAFVIGLIMDFGFGKAQLRQAKEKKMEATSSLGVPWKGLLVIFLLVAIYMVGLNLFKGILLVVAFLLGYILFSKEECKSWHQESWSLFKQIFPILLIGVFIASGLKAFVPPSLIVKLFGRESFVSNMFSSVIGAFLYFSTLTEVPITQSFIEMGMSSGSAIAFLLAGPALSLPSMITINRVMGWKRGLSYIGLVILFSAISGSVYEFIF